MSVIGYKVSADSFEYIYDKPKAAIPRQEVGNKLCDFWDGITRGRLDAIKSMGVVLKSLKIKSTVLPLPVSAKQPKRREELCAIQLDMLKKESKIEAIVTRKPAIERPPSYVPTVNKVREMNTIPTLDEFECHVKKIGTETYVIAKSKSKRATSMFTLESIKRSSPQLLLRILSAQNV